MEHVIFEMVRSPMTIWMVHVTVLMVHGDAGFQRSAIITYGADTSDLNTHYDGSSVGVCMYVAIIDLQKQFQWSISRL